MLPSQMPKPDSVSPVTGRAWCFTSFSEDEVARLKKMPGVAAMCVGEEIAPATQKTHFQGYIRFDNPVRFSFWKNQFPTLHVERRRGTEAEAAEYCRKDGKVLIDFGCAVAAPVPADAASVLDGVLDLLDSGAPMWQIRKYNRRFFFHNYRKIQDYKSQIELETGLGGYAIT